MAADRPLLWPTIGTVLFVLTVPGTVVVYLPYALSRWTFGTPLLGIRAGRWLGLAFIGGALPVFVDFIVRFVREGEGTPAPIAPTLHLVVGGTFRYVRNPGYIAVVSLLVGQAFLFGSRGILLYALGVAVAFHLFVVLYEEPTLRRRFGSQYEAYCRMVPRWLPRLRLPR